MMRLQHGAGPVWDGEALELRQRHVLAAITPAGFPDKSFFAQGVQVLRLGIVFLSVEELPRFC